jgi:zinc protease
MYRGPDAEFDRADTYGADVTGYLMDDPSGVFKQMLCSVPELMIPGSDYVSEGYLTKKEGGIIQLSAVMLQPEKNLADRAKLLLNTLNRKVFPDFSDGTAVSPAKLQNVYQKLQDYRIMEMETASGLLDTLLNWWVTADAGYYYTYNENMQKTGTVEVASFVNKYFTGRNPVVVVLVNPDVYNADKQDFIDSGYTEITKENAFWWRDAK